MSDKQRVEDLLLSDLQERCGPSIPWTGEYEPCPARRWRIDIAQVDTKLSIEIDGSRYHSSAEAQRKNAEKANYLVANGWRCLRYPASSVFNNKRRAFIVDQIAMLIFNVEADDEFHAHVLTGEL